MDNQVEEIKQRLNIVEVIQEYLKLTPAGSNYKANCPFHQEKTPSFMVSEDKQIWHCFGCNEGGDVFSFVMKIEGMDFPETLKLLAAKAGVQLQRQRQNPERENQRTRLLDLHASAAAYYHDLLLTSPQAQPARDYLKQRGVTEATLESFQIGYSWPDWEAGRSFFRGQGYTDEEIFAGGLSIQKDRARGYYDRFRGRIMFPLADPHGQIVGFGGRILPSLEDKQSAKYVNTPQTLVYNKSSILFGLHRAKQAIQKAKVAVVVEGYMDALSSHQAGVENVVASGGTALTAEQVRLLKRYAPAIALSFDMDAAGTEAVRRGLEVAWQQELETKVIRLPFGKDPDECIQRDPGAWRKAIQDARQFMDYYIEKVCADNDITLVQGKKRAAKELLPLVARLPNPIERTHYLQQLAKLLRIDEQTLRDAIGRPAPGGSRPVSTSTGTTEPKRDRATQLGDLVLGLALQQPEQFLAIADQLRPEHFLGEGRGELYTAMIMYYTQNTIFDGRTFLADLAQRQPALHLLAQTVSLYAEAHLAELAEPDARLVRKTVLEAVSFLKRQQLLESITRLEQRLKQAETDRDREQIKLLSEEVTRLTEALVQLQ